jgi:hypothetical protein
MKRRLSETIKVVLPMIAENSPWGNNSHTTRASECSETATSKGISTQPRERIIYIISTTEDKRPRKNSAGHRHQIIMNQEDDEDAFLYGGASQGAGASGRPAAVQSSTAERDLDRASEEGEVDDEDEQGESDSVSLPFPSPSNSRTLSLLLKPSQENELLHRRMFIGSFEFNARSAQPFALRVSSQSRPTTTQEKAASTVNQIKAGMLVLFQWVNVETSVAAPALPTEAVEIDKVAEYNGQPLYNLELESLEDKPWRKPGGQYLGNRC